MREFTGNFCAYFSRIIIVLTIVVIFPAVTRAQDATHQLTSDGMKVPDSLSNSASQSAAEVNDSSDQGDQLSDSDAKKKQLNKLIPNIAIGRENNKQSDIADIMNLIASMPEGVQEKLMADAAQAKDYCTHNSLLMNFYDCSCFSLEIVNERIKRGPDFSLVELIDKGQYKECVDMGLVYGYGQNRCNQSLTQMNVTTGQLKDICECTGKMLARNYVVKPMPSIRFINYLFTDVLAACRQRNGF